jgi:hypothetical protein
VSGYCPTSAGLAHPAVFLKDKKRGRPERGSDRTAQFFGSDFCQMNLLQALPAGAIASLPFIAASLIGLKGVLSPKVQVQAPSRRHVLITRWAKRPLKSGLPAVTEGSSTETSDAEAPP